MIFDIPASISSKRRYLVINGVDVTPFNFPYLKNEDFYNFYPSAFIVTRSEATNALTLNIKTEYASDLDASYLGIGEFHLKEFLSTFGENIEDYNKISFVVSCENYDSPASYSIASMTDISTTTMTYYDVEDKSIERMNDGDKSIYRFNLQEFYNLDYMLIRFNLGSIHSFDAAKPPKLHIHAIYLE